MPDRENTGNADSGTSAEGELVVLNRYGVHARPAALLVKTASMFRSDITVEKGEMKVSGKSIMGLMTLEAGLGTKVRIVAKGVDATKALDAISELFEKKFFEE